MRFPVKEPVLALDVFWDDILLKSIRVLDDHCSPRTLTFVKLIKIPEVALELG